MKIELEDEDVTRIADAVVEALNAKKSGESGNGGGGGEGDDLLGLGGEGEDEEITLETMSEKVGEFVRKLKKDKVLAAIQKVAGKSVTNVKGIPKDKYQAVLDALGKVK